MNYLVLPSLQMAKCMLFIKFTWNYSLSTQILPISYVINMNIWLSGVFGGYKVGTLTRNGLGKGAVTDLFSIIWRHFIK